MAKVSRRAWKILHSLMQESGEPNLTEADIRDLTHAFIIACQIKHLSYLEAGEMVAANWEMQVALGPKALEGMKIAGRS
jgi:hypothetical protein